MTMMLFGLTLISFIGMATNIFLYLRSSQILLELVQTDEALWERLGRPELVRGREGRTISPLFPWLSWVWAGEPAGLTPKIRTQLMATSRQLKTGLLLFVATTTIFLALFFFRCLSRDHRDASHPMFRRIFRPALLQPLAGTNPHPRSPRPVKGRWPHTQLRAPLAASGTPQR